MSMEFFTPRVRLAGGKSVSLFGGGPPVMFSSGLYGLMSRRIYTKLFREMEQKVTLVVLNDASPVTEKIFEDTAEALAVDRLGFLAHSSFDANILRSDRVGRAVLCDPVVTPELSMMRGMASKNVVCKQPVLTINAEKAYARAAMPIPDFLAPKIIQDFTADSSSVSTAPPPLVFPGVGHADLLDDLWAELGRNTLPWVESITPTPVSFHDWSFRGTERNANDVRSEYRSWVAKHALDHLLGVSEPVPDELVIHVEKSAAESITDVRNSE